MILVLAASALGMLALPGFSKVLWRRLGPSEWARLSTCALALGALTLESILVLLATPTVLRAAGVQGVAHTCDRLLGHVAPGGSGLGSAAALAALGLPLVALVGGVRSFRGRRAARVEPGLGDQTDLDGYRLVVLPTPSPLAFSTPGRPPQVVVSRGLLDTLPTPAAAALVAHESAHIRHAHHRFLVLAAALERALGFVPFVRPSVAALRSALERWADEEAAATEPGRREALQDALDRVSAQWERSVVGSQIGDVVAERAAALDHPPARQGSGMRLALYGPASLFGVTAVVLLGSWVGDAHAVLALTGLCP